MDEDRPYAPSARKLKRAREAGDVAKSPLASSALVLLAGGAAIAFALPAWLETWRAFTTRALTGHGNVEEAAEVVAAGLAWPLGVTVVIGALAGFLQVGPLFTAKPLALDLARLDPLKGLARMFRPSELGARLLPAGLGLALALIALSVMRDATGLFGRTGSAPDAVLSSISMVLGAFYWRACAVIAVSGVAALVYRRYRYWQDQHMSRLEVLRERRELEGQPAARRRRERRHREFLTTPTLAEAIRRSSLVVRGVSVSVFIGWEDTERAPVVLYVARGTLASAAGVSDDALARELAGLAIGAQAPRGTWLRLAEHIGGSLR